jgi:hypothetical protein
MILLPDGGAMIQEGGISNQWLRLAPDSTGGYENATWSSLASMNIARRFFGSDVLTDGRVMILGGEDSGPSGDRNWTNSGEIYDPVIDKWSDMASFPHAYAGDITTETLPDGRVIAGNPFGPETEIYNPAINRWTPGPLKLNGDVSNEETWVKLPDGSILSYNINQSPQTAQRYVPSLNAWVSAGSIPLQPVDETELGPAVLLPDQRVMFLGATGQTAFYTPPTSIAGVGSWTQGPQIPNGLGAFDAPAANLVNGHVLLVCGGTYASGLPTTIFDFDPKTNEFTTAPIPVGMDLEHVSTVNTRLLALPSGQVLFTSGTDNLFLYTPDGSPSDSWRPAIDNITSTGNNLFTLSGTQLNGISEGASYGDDAQMATNYPIVQLTDSNGVVRYARTSHWSSTGVATGKMPVSVQFSLPAGAPNVNRLRVIANGIASPSVILIRSQSITTNDTVTIAGRLESQSSTFFVDDNGEVSQWADVASVFVSTGDGNDNFNINGIPSATSVSIDGGGGDDTFNLTPLTNNQTDLQVKLTLSGGAGTNSVVFNDRSNQNISTWTIGSTSIALNNSPAILMKSIQNRSIYGGRSGTTYNIVGTAAGTTNVIVAGAGDDFFNITPVNKFVDDLQGQLIVDGSGGVNTLTENDQSNPYNDTWTIGATSLSRNSAATTSFSNLSQVTLNGSNNGSSTGVTAYNLNKIPASTVLTVNAGNGSDTLRGPNVNSVFTLAGANTGSVGNVNFSGIENLVGGNGNDRFQFGPTASISGFVDGASGSDTLATMDNSNIWRISSGNTGSVNGQPFSRIENLTGGSGDDSFQLLPSGFVSGMIDGGSGKNLLSYSALNGSVYVNLQSRTATAVGGGFSNIQSLTGTAGNSNVLAGPNSHSTWQISDINSGSVNGTAFSAFQTLTGGAGNDVFQIGPKGIVAGSIDGSGGSNSLDYSNDLSNVLVNLQSKTATRIAGTFTNMTSLIGSKSTNTLVGTNSNSTWKITGASSGTLNSTFLFRGVQNLTGSSGNDTFQFVPGGFVSGLIDGGGGNDSLDYSALSNSILINLQTKAATAAGAGITNIRSLLGSSNSASVLVAPNTNNMWQLTGTNAGSVNGIGFSSFSNLIGGNGNDLFQFGPSGIISGVIDGTAGSDTITAASIPNTWRITSGNAGRLNGQAFQRIANLQGGTAEDTFQFFPTGFVAGAIDGGNGTNWLDYSANNSSISVNLQTRGATAAGGGVSNIQNVRGSNGGSTLVGNLSGNILIGGTGTDTIVGGGGKSLLIGGKGADKITGGTDDDIIIGGFTGIDSDFVGLTLVLAEWQSNNTYLARINHIKGTSAGGLNGSVLLNFGTNVFDDGTSKLLTGLGGSNWFFTGNTNFITDLRTGQQVN